MEVEEMLEEIHHGKGEMKAFAVDTESEVGSVELGSWEKIMRGNNKSGVFYVHDSRQVVEKNELSRKKILFLQCP